MYFKGELLCRHYSNIFLCFVFLCVGDCYTPLSQGPCQEGEWLIMKKGGEEGVCSKTPCDSPIQVKYCEQRLIQEAEQKRQNVSKVAKETRKSLRLLFIIFLFQFLKNGECIFGVDLARRSQLCSSGKRPWYSVYGDWNCQTVYLSLPFGLISDKTTPQDPVWAKCKSLQN